MRCFFFLKGEICLLAVDLTTEYNEFESGITVAEIAKSIGMGLYKAALGGRINENIVTCELP